MDIITSRNNQKIKDIAALQKQKKVRQETGLFVIEGIRIVRDAVKSPACRVKQLLLSRSFYESSEYQSDSWADRLVEASGTEVIVAEDRVFELAAETMTPQGVIAVVEKPSYSLEDILGKDAEGKKTKILALEAIQDPGNLGTIFRTAEAAGMSGIIMSRDTVEIFNPKVIRSTMSSVFRVPFVYADDFTESLKQLKGNGFKVYASYLHGGIDYDKTEYADRLVMLVGNEGNGLSDEAVGTADCRVYIPMSGEIESLNAAVAAALLMYKCR